MKRALAGFGLAFAAAELAGAYLPLSALLLTAAFLLLAALVWRVRRAVFPACLPVVLGLAAGTVWAAGYQGLVAAPQRALAGQTVTVTAVVQTDAEPSFQEGRLRGTLVLQGVPGCSAGVRAYCSSFPGAEPGEQFRAVIRLEELEQDAYRLGRYADGTFLSAVYLDGYEPLEPSRSPVFALYELRMGLSRRLRLYLPRPLGGVEAAMLLGDRTQLTDTLEESFRAAGVSHLLSISGLHFSLLCGLFLIGPLAGTLRFNRLYILFEAAVLLFYMALTGFPVSVVRAGVIYFIMLLGYALVQPPDTLTSLGVAALFLGLQNAYAACDLGCQLSFCGVLGVQLGAAVGRWQRQRWLPEEEEEDPDVPGWRRRLLRAGLQLLETLETAALATVATLPSLLAHGMSTSGVSVLTNLLVVWMLCPALVLGILVLLFGAVPLLLPCMRMASLLLSLWLHWMVGIIGWCAALPAAYLYLPRRYTLLVLTVLILLGVLFWRRGRVLWFLPAAALCLAVSVGLGVRLQRDVVRVALVGTSGNACAVVSQNGHAVVFFRGGASNLNAVQTYLDENGRLQWDAVIDLRQDPVEQDFPQQTARITLDTLPRGPAQPSLPGGWELDCWHDGGGNLAVLGIDGYHIAFTAGQPDPGQPVTVDLLCAAASLPECVQPRAILTNASEPRLQDWDTQAKVYRGDTPTAVLRPGRSATFEEVKPIAVQ